MPIGTFIRKILTELITEAMAEVCITGVEGHYVTFQYASCVAAPKASTNGVYLDPISSALAINAANKEGVLDSPEMASNSALVETRANELAAAQELADTAGVLSPEAQAQAEADLQAAAAAFAEAQESFFDTKEGMEGAAGDTFRFDVNQFYGGELLPLVSTTEPISGYIADNSANSQYNYMMIYGDFSDPYHSGTGNQEEDEAAGTYHFHLARDRGLVKNISFSKNNIPYHRESRMFNQGQAGNLQLSAVYDCTISMIGNTLFLPGMEIYINPYGFGGEDFGEPFERPLEYRSPTAAAARKYNSAHSDTLSTGAAVEGMTDGQAGQSVAELEFLDGALDSFNKQFKEADAKKLPVTVNSYANLMGIGGYQLITGIQCTIGPGKYETTIKAKHTYTGYPQLQQSQKLIEFRQNQENISSADSGVTNACTAILKQQEVKFDSGG